MVKALSAILKWIAFCLAPVYVALMVATCLFMWLTTGYLDTVLELWPVMAILCLPAAGMVAASVSIPPANRGQ